MLKTLSAATPGRFKLNILLKPKIWRLEVGEGEIGLDCVTSAGGGNQLVLGKGGIIAILYVQTNLVIIPYTHQHSFLYKQRNTQISLLEEYKCLKQENKCRRNRRSAINFLSCFNLTSQRPGWRHCSTGRRGLILPSGPSF